ncbi:MAG: TSUP family transporter, partial [Mariprofundaceae bacterium]
MQETHLLLIIYGLAVGLAAGGLGGTLAALAGVGGGLIYVPVFYALMPQADQGMSVQILASMLAIVLTGGFSARSHYRLGHIDMSVSRQLIPGLI